MKILQKIWEWFFRLICFGFSDKESKETEESRLIEDYSKRLDNFRSAAQAVIADHYRIKMLLESELAALEEAKTAEQADPDSPVVHNRLAMIQERVDLLEKQASSTGIQANKALNELEKLTYDLKNTALRLQDAQIAKRAAEMHLAAENWRMESELGLNKEMNALNRLEQEARQTQRKAELTQQTNEVLSGEFGEKKAEE